MKSSARLLIIALSMLESCPAQSPTATIYITGKLDGYASGPNAQTFDPWFNRYRKESFHESAVLVGVGDNLALDY